MTADRSENHTREGRVKKVASSAKDKQEAVRLYQETDLTVEEIASRFNVTRPTIHRWADEAGVPVRGARGPRPKDRPRKPPPSAEGLLGRLMDENRELRRELAAFLGAAETQWAHTNQALEALTATVNQLLGRLQAQQETTSEYVGVVRDFATRQTALLEQALQQRLDS